MQLTAIYIPCPEGFAAFVAELPGTNTQGETLEETRVNLREAVKLLLAANRELAEPYLVGKELMRESFESTDVH